MSKYNIGDRVTATITGEIVKIEKDYGDKKVRYFVTGGHCVNAFVTEEGLREPEFECEHCGREFVEGARHIVYKEAVQNDGSLVDIQSNVCRECAEIHTTK
jgi:hypothetical protein